MSGMEKASPASLVYFFTICFSTFTLRNGSFHVICEQTSQKIALEKQRFDVGNFDWYTTKMIKSEGSLTYFKKKERKNGIKNLRDIPFVPPYSIRKFLRIFS